MPSLLSVWLSNSFNSCKICSLISTYSIIIAKQLSLFVPIISQHGFLFKKISIKAPYFKNFGNK